MNELLVKLRKAYPDKYADLKKAYEFAEKAHAGQKRSSGEDYFIHPCAVVEILADYGFDSSTLIAAFLHDVLEDDTQKRDPVVRHISATESDGICAPKKTPHKANTATACVLRTTFSGE